MCSAQASEVGLPEAWVAVSIDRTQVKGFSSATCFIITSVLDEVVLEGTCQDGGQKASQQHHCHTGVDDAEPVNLQARQDLMRTVPMHLALQQ